MELWIVKVIALLCIWLITLLFGLLPIKLIRVIHTWNTLPGDKIGHRLDMILSSLNSFTGGVFLGTTFLHLFPEVMSNIEVLTTEYGIQFHYPLAEFIMCVGFFFVMILEHLIMSLQHHHGDIPLDWPALSPRRGIEQKPHSGEQSPFLVHQKVQERRASYGTTDWVTACTSESRSQSNPTNSPITAETNACIHIISPTHHQKHHTDRKQLQGIRSFILLVALSLHTVFEGLALGLLSNEQQTWNLLIALVIHKVVLAFTLGIEFSKNMSNVCRVVAFMLLFSLMSPVGVAIGISLVESQNLGAGSQVAAVVLKALATGTFIYVTFFEVLQREVGQDHNLLKVGAAVLGFGCMAALAMVTTH